MKSDDTLTSVVCFVFVAWLFGAFDSESLFAERYLVVCATDLPCRPFAHIVYRVMPTTQTVVEKFEKQAPALLEHCRVFDRNNWRCGGTFDWKSFSDGVFSEAVPLPKPFVSVSKWEWRFFSARAWLADALRKSP